MAVAPFVTIDMIPDGARLQMAFDNLISSIRSYREPLKRSIQRVIAPSLRENFASGGRPPWEPLSEATLFTKEWKGQGSEVLVATGTLQKVAGQLNLWKIDGPGGSASMQLPGKAEYGALHQNGTRFMPQREWAVFQSEDEDAIAEIFAEWIEERVNRALW